MQFRLKWQLSASQWFAIVMSFQTPPVPPNKTQAHEEKPPVPTPKEVQRMLLRRLPLQTLEKKLTYLKNNSDI